MLSASLCTLIASRIIVRQNPLLPSPVPRRLRVNPTLKISASQRSSTSLIRYQHRDPQ